MALVLYSGPTAEPISVTEAKTHVRVTGTDDDTLIGALITVAREYIESATGRALVLQTWDWTRDRFATRLDVPLSPLRSVVSVKYNDSDGTEQTLATSGYTVDEKSEPPRIVEAYSESWPETRGHVNDVTIRFRAGYAVPFTATAATDVLAATAHDLADTDVVQVYNTGGALPAGLSANTNYYVISSTTDSLKLSLTSGGAAIDITDTGTGTHFIGVVPRALRQAMLLIIGHLYERREDTITGTIIDDIPMGAAALLSPYKIQKFY